RRRHTRFSRDWSSDVCSSDLDALSSGVVTAGTLPPVSGGDRCHRRYLDTLVTGVRAVTALLPTRGYRSDLHALSTRTGAVTALTPPHSQPLPGTHRLSIIVRRRFTESSAVIAEPLIKSKRTAYFRTASG